LNAGISVLVLALWAAWPGAGLAQDGLAQDGLAQDGPAQDGRALATYEVVSPPSCANNRGEEVRFVESDRRGAGIAAGMANRDGDGNPVVFRSNYAAAPPDYQKFIDRHECAHHQTGDVDRPHPPRNGPEHLMNESISDCIAILRLRDEDGYDRAGFDRVAAAMREEMARIGFPEISISSRIGNIRNCYANYGAPQEFIDGVLERRGLRRP
jgi:hypothetical protein